MEFSVGSLNPSAWAVMPRSIGNVVPARAAHPRGHLFILLNASRNLSASLENLNAWASICCARVTGWACCMWVNPGITVSPFSSAMRTRAIIRLFAASAAWSAASRRYMRKSVATWSFLLLAVCSLPPAGPIASVNANSMQVCTSSLERSNAKVPASTSLRMSLRPFSMESASSAGMTPQAFSILTWARDPMTS